MTESMRKKNNEFRSSQSDLRTIIEEENPGLDDEDLVEKQQLREMLLCKYEAEAPSAKDSFAATS